MADPFLNYFALGLLFFVVAVLFFALSRRALKAGDALVHLVPDAGHLVHMLEWCRARVPRPAGRVSRSHQWQSKRATPVHGARWYFRK